MRWAGISTKAKRRRACACTSFTIRFLRSREAAARRHRCGGREVASQTWLRIARQTGSHAILRREHRTAVVPMHKPIKPGTLRGLIERRA
jgi:hypothetical protein